MIFILGLCLGSFVNMLVYRVARKYKLEKDKFKVKNNNRSHCDFCGKQLSWYENVPIISWLLQGGKSRCCLKKLSTLYPIVEIMTGILFLIYYFFGRPQESPLQLVSGFLIIVLLVFLAVFDFKYMILPDFAVATLIIISFLGVVFDEPNIIPYLISAIISGGFFLFLYLITKKKGMGFGDVKLAVFMGLFLGWPKILVAIYIAFIIGALVGVVGMILKKINKKSKIAFGPFLIFGTIIAWIWGDQIINLIR